MVSVEWVNLKLRQQASNLSSVRFLEVVGW